MFDDSEKDRRRRPPDNPAGYIEGLPTKLLLDRLPVPILAVHQAGTIVYANGAFEHMLGYPRSELVDHPAGQIFADGSTSNPSPATVQLNERAGDVVDLLHSDGTTLRALVSESVLVREDDPVALVAFHDVTEQLWTQGPLVAQHNWHGSVRGEPR